MTMKLIDDDDDNDDSNSCSSVNPILIEPKIITKDFRISVNMLDANEVKTVLNEDAKVFTAEESADECDEPSLKRDQRRLHLLNNPNYGIILDFIEKFRVLLNLNLSSLRKLEENLLSEKDELNPQFNELLLTLFRRVSSNKPIPKERFIPTIIRFAGRYSDHDAEQIENHGYAQASIDTKVRVLKNVLEKQFDRNKTFKHFVDNQRSWEIRSKPFGRDRFGASYWLFMDDKCFIRLFRENVDKHRSWMNVAKNRDELESLIKLLISDHVVRKKFPDWKFNYEPFNQSTSSDEFEERFAPNWSDLYESSETTRKTKSSLSSESSVLLYPNTVKTENVDLHPTVSVDRNDTVSPPQPLKITSESKDKQVDSDQESGNSSVIDVNRRQSNSSNETKSDDFYSVASDEIKANVDQNEENQDVSEIKVENELIESSSSKFKLVDYDDSGSDRSESETKEVVEEEEPFHLEIPEDLLPTFDNGTADNEDSPSNKSESQENNDLPIALRRSKRSKRASTIDRYSSSSSSSVSLSRTNHSKRSAERMWRNPQRPTGRSRRRRRRGGRFSSTSTENEKPSEDDDDLEENLSNNDDDLIEEEEENDDDDDGTPISSAKTVAKIFEKMTLTGKPSTNLPSIACLRCEKSDRPESLLLCEDCDDAYHLECNQPELFSIPEYSWFCSLCDHKRLCDSLTEKLLQLIKDDRYSQIKRRIAKVKRIPPPFQEYPRPGAPIKPPVVIPPPVKPAPAPTPTPKVMNKRRINTILSSDEEEEPQQKQQVKRKTVSIDEQMETEMIRNVKNEPVEEQQQQQQQEQQSQQEDNLDEEPGKRRMRTCRKQTTDYRFDAFDSKIKEAIIETTTEKSHADSDSDATEIMSEGEKQKISDLHQEFDNDFDGDDGRNNDDDDFVPYARRSGDEDSRTAIKDNNNDSVPTAADEAPKKRKRQRKTSNSSTKKKSTPKAPAARRRRKTNASAEGKGVAAESKEGGAIPIDTDLKGEANVVFKQDEGVFVAVKPRRQRRAPAKKKKNTIQQENMSDEEQNNGPLPTKRPYNRRRSGSNDSFIGDDDDYEKLAQKRRLFHHGRVIERKSILSHIKKLVGDEEVAGDEEGEEEEEQDDETDPEKSRDGDSENKSKAKKKPTNDYNEQVISDDDDFPDEQEIMRTIGVSDLKSAPTIVPNASIFRCQFMAPMQNYQFTMVDPTAHLDFLAPAEATTSEPSDLNGNPSESIPPTSTENI